MLLVKSKRFILRLTKTMETFNSRNLVHLWESWDNCGTLHIGYSVCVNISTLSIYGA